MELTINKTRCALIVLAAVLAIWCLGIFVEWTPKKDVVRDRHNLSGAIVEVTWGLDETHVTTGPVVDDGPECIIFGETGGSGLTDIPKKYVKSVRIIRPPSP